MRPPFLRNLSLMSSQDSSMRSQTWDWAQCHIAALVFGAGFKVTVRLWVRLWVRVRVSSRQIDFDESRLGSALIWIPPTPTPGAPTAKYPKASATITSACGGQLRLSWINESKRNPDRGPKLKP